MIVRELLITLRPEITVLVAASVIMLLGAVRLGGLALPVAVAGLLIGCYFCCVEMTRVSSGVVVASPMASLVKVITFSVGVLLLMVSHFQSRTTERAEFMAMMLCSLAGVALVAGANDLIVLFLALELVSFPTYVMVAVSRPNLMAQEAGSKYFFLGAMASALLLYGLSFLFGAAGSSDMELLKTITRDAPIAPMITIGTCLVLGGLAFKLAVVPFHFYAPDVYQGAAAPITGLLAFVPKMAGFVALVNLFWSVAWIHGRPLHPSWLVLLYLLAVLTMTVGNVGALLQSNVKRILAYSSVAHSGYVLVALVAGPLQVRKNAMGACDGLAAMLFYLATYGVMNLGAFAVLASVRRGDDEAEHISDLSGLARHRPWSALAMTVCLFSLMGMPLTAGFVGKFYLFSSAVATGDSANQVLVIIAMVNTAIGAVYYLRIIGQMYLHEQPVRTSTVPSVLLRLGVASCVLITLYLGVLPSKLMQWLGQGVAARQVTPQAISEADKAPERGGNDERIGPDW